MSASAGAPLNPRLLAVLATVLAMAAWLQWQSADDVQGDEAGLLASPDQRVSRAPSGPVRGQSGDERGGVASAQQTLARYVSQASPPPGSQRAPTWLTAEPPPPAAPPRQLARLAAPPPMAPRFPYAWVGRLDDEPTAGSPALQRAVVQGLQGVWVVRVGDVIEHTWRVERIQARVMQLTYLPLGQSQTVSLP